MKTFLTILTILFFVINLNAQQGCTDPNATNYTASATYNDGSCTYNNTNYSFTQIANLPATLDEISGMIYYNGKIYGHQDSGGPAKLYEVDPITGVITKTITLQGATNVDWEDLTQDDTHIYIADTGNNAHGNRTDLKIYKFPKSSIVSGANITIPNAAIETINFSYEDQTDFTPKDANSTEFDCEAIAYNRGKLHLFTKNWIGDNSVHYVLPITAGTYVAEKKDSIDVGTYKITGASFGAWDFLTLIAYEVTGTGECALFLDFGFDGTYYYLNTGAKRRLDLGSALTLGQLEGVCFENALKGFASNEKFTYTVPLLGTQTVPQQLYSFNIATYIQNYYDHNRIVFNPNAQGPKAGVIRFNANTKVIEGYDGTHWCPFNN